MVRKFIGIISLVAISVLSLSTVVKADGMGTFTYQSAGNTFTWQLPASPVVDGVDVFPGIAFVLNDVPVYENGGPAEMGSFMFFSTSCAGGFDLSFGDDLMVNTGWEQLYSGPESNPTFLTGTYSLTDDAVNISGLPGTLVVPGTPAVPEPSALVQLTIGLLALGLCSAAKRMNGATAMATE